MTDRAGFAEMLERLLSNGARTIIVESPDRFARELMVQLAGHDMLKAKGTRLIAASAPTFFLEDTPTAVLVRQVLGAIAQFEKAGLVAKLAAARKRKRVANGKCEGRKSLAETRPEVVALARSLARKKPKGGKLSLRALWRLRAASTSADSPSTIRASRPCWRRETRVVGNQRAKCNHVLIQIIEHHPSARHREPTRPETHLQATAGSQLHFRLEKVCLCVQVSDAIRLLSGQCRLN